MPAFLERLLDRMGINTADKSQLVLVGALVLIIAIAAVPIFSSYLGGGGKVTVDPNRKVHLYCMKARQEYTVKQSELKHNAGNSIMTEETMGSVSLRYFSPLSNAYTGVMMMECPSCKKFYAPEAQNPNIHQNGFGRIVCPHCNTDIDKFHEEQAR